MGGQGQRQLLVPSGLRHSSLPSKQGAPTLLTGIKAQQCLSGCGVLAGSSGGHRARVGTAGWKGAWHEGAGAEGGGQAALTCPGGWVGKRQRGKRVWLGGSGHSGVWG